MAAVPRTFWWWVVRAVRSTRGPAGRPLPPPSGAARPVVAQPQARASIWVLTLPASSFGSGT